MSNYYPVIAGENAIQSYINCDIAKRISLYMNRIRDLGDINIRILFQKGFGKFKHILLDKILLYNPFNYITPFKNYIPDTSICWQKIIPLNSSPDTLLSTVFLNTNYLKICYDISKALYSLKKIGIIHNDTCLDNVGIYKGNFVLFDFDGSGEPLEKDKDYTHDYCTILNSFKFYGVELPLEMKKFIGIYSLIEIVSTLYMKKDFNNSLEYLESLKIRF
jgi:hypothetical protein